MDDRLGERIDDKLNSVMSSVGQLNERAARIETTLIFFEKSNQKVEDHEKRLTALEALELRKYETRLGKVERIITTFKGYIAGAIAVISTVGGLMLWYLNSVIEKISSH